MADTNPLEFPQRKHPDLDINQHGLTLWDLEREFATGGFGGKKLMKLREILGVLREGAPICPCRQRLRKAQSLVRKPTARRLASPRLASDRNLKARAWVEGHNRPVGAEGDRGA